MSETISPSDAVAPRALVTGAGIRLGREMALELARAGYDVAVHFAGSKDGAEQTAQDIRALGRRAAVFQADLTREEEVTPLIGHAVAGLGGPLTCLINNASVFEHDTLARSDRTSWDRHMESNLRAPVVLTQAFAAQVPDPVQEENGGLRAQGIVVNMLDQRVKKLTPEFMSYTIAKMGLWAFTQTAAQALAPKVRVNGIGPGSTLRGHTQTEAHFAAQRAAKILKRGPDPVDICAALLYFLNAPAVTGQILCVDGGQHLSWQTPDIIGRTE